MQSRFCACARKNGIKHARIEIGWGNLNYADETILNNSKDAATRLLACKATGIRPLILLNGHHGAPCPMTSFARTVTADVPAGAGEVFLDKTDDLILHHSGLSNPQRYIAAEFLVTRIQGHKVTLSKPWPTKLAAGTKVKMATLKYCAVRGSRHAGRPGHAGRLETLCPHYRGVCRDDAGHQRR